MKQYKHKNIKYTVKHINDNVLTISNYTTYIKLCDNTEFDNCGIFKKIILPNNIKSANGILFHNVSSYHCIPHSIRCIENNDIRDVCDNKQKCYLKHIKCDLSVKLLNCIFIRNTYDTLCDENNNNNKFNIWLNENKQHISIHCFNKDKKIYGYVCKNIRNAKIHMTCKTQYILIFRNINNLTITHRNFMYYKNICILKIHNRLEIIQATNKLFNIRMVNYSVNFDFDCYCIKNGNQKYNINTINKNMFNMLKYICVLKIHIQNENITNLNILFNIHKLYLMFHWKIQQTNMLIKNIDILKISFINYVKNMPNDIFKISKSVHTLFLFHYGINLIDSFHSLNSLNSSNSSNFKYIKYLSLNQTTLYDFNKFKNVHILHIYELNKYEIDVNKSININGLKNINTLHISKYFAQKYYNHILSKLNKIINIHDEYNGNYDIYNVYNLCDK